MLRASVPLAQVGFFEVVVMPLYQSLSVVVPAAHSMLATVSENYLMWRHRCETSS